MGGTGSDIAVMVVEVVMAAVLVVVVVAYL